MFTCNYTAKLDVVESVNVVGSLVEESKRTVIQFATLEDACIAVCAVRASGCVDAFVSNTEDTNARYLIPKRIQEMFK